MHNTLEPSFMNLNPELILNHPLPRDCHENHSFLTPKKLAPSSGCYEHLQLLVDRYVTLTKGKRGPKQVQGLKKHWEWVLLNLADALLSRRWVLVQMDSKKYSNDFFLKEFSYRTTSSIVQFLKDSCLCRVITGKKYEVQPFSTRLFPLQPLAADLLCLFLQSEQEIKPPYVKINEAEPEWNFVSSLPNEHPDVLDMTQINEFLKGHTWACKGPVRLVYKGDPFHAGRLITDFQNLPDRAIRLRINTTIDEKPICEVDFSANHLRLNLAVLSNQDAGATPYEDIGELAGQSRDQVKTFITVVMGASSRSAAGNALFRKGMDDETFCSLEQASVERFPKLSLFSGWGVYAQSLEGAILKRVMLEGVSKGIVALPVHDAVAVQQEHADWAQEAMLKGWDEVVGKKGPKPRLKVDYPVAFI
jgi:hypothetical protein